MNVLFLRTPIGECCTADMVDDAINYLLDLYTDNYETQLSQMSERQRTLFRAIAAEGQAKNISGGGFIKKYKLLSASSVVSAAKGLLEKDYVTHENGTYIVYDPFFALWMQRRQ